MLLRRNVLGTASVFLHGLSIPGYPSRASRFHDLNILDIHVCVIVLCNLSFIKCFVDLYLCATRLCVKAVTEPDSAESTEITDQTRTESTEYNGKLRFFQYRDLASLPGRLSILLEIKWVIK